MAAANTDKLKKYKSLFSTTLSTSIGTGTSDTLTPATVTGLPTDTAITLTIDRVDSSGTPTPTKVERIVGVVSGGNIINYLRGIDGTTEQAHSAGAVVEMIWNADDWNDLVDWGLAEHGQDGKHTDATVTTLKATGAEINTGTEDAKIVTPKAIQDSTIAKVPASALDNVTGTDNTEFITPLANVPAFNSSLARQAIINGNFDVWQRGTSFNQATAKVYGADRWATFNNVTNQASTITRQDGTGVYGSTYCLRYQRTAGQTGTNICILVTSIETINTQKLRGKKLTLSFYARKGANYSPTSSVFTSAIRTGTGTDEEVLNGYTGVNDTLTQNNTLTTDWQKFTYTTPTVLADNVSELSLWFTWTPTGTAGAADYFEITQVQLCAGDVALPFMPKSFDEELRACQRYYEIIDFTLGKATSTSAGEMSGRFMVAKRTAPAATTNFIIISSTNNIGEVGVSLRSFTTISAVNSSTVTGFNIAFTGSGSLTSGNLLQLSAGLTAVNVEL